MKNLEPYFEEYGLELDDIRWYLSVELAEDLLKNQTTPRRLIEDIWSGKLGDRLYNFEERALESMAEAMDLGKIEVAAVRELFAKAKRAKRNRWIEPRN